MTKYTANIKYIGIGIVALLIVIAIIAAPNRNYRIKKFAAGTTDTDIIINAFPYKDYVFELGSNSRYLLFDEIPQDPNWIFLESNGHICSLVGFEIDSRESPTTIMVDVNFYVRTAEGLKAEEAPQEFKKECFSHLPKTIDAYLLSIKNEEGGRVAEWRRIELPVAVP